MRSRTLPHYLVVNRFDDECGHYHRFAEGIDCRLSYVTLPVGLQVIARSTAQQVVVVDSLDFTNVVLEAKRLIDQHGEFDGIVGISEKDVLLASYLREEFGTPGWRSDFVRRFRDKPTMKQVVGGAGLRVPAFLALDTSLTARDLVRTLGLPLVLKPRQEGASRGVRVVRDEAELRRVIASVEPADYECEEFIPGEIYHVDGVRRSGQFHFVSVSRYLNTCLDFARGLPLGSVVLDPGELRDRLVGFATQCFDALGLTDGPFHLEVIGSEVGEPVFLEVGIRPGGGEVSFIHRDLFGIDLFGEAFRVTLGLPAMNRREEFSEPVGAGWVSVPEPRPWPSRVTARRSLLGVVPEMYAELIPEIGEVFDGTGGYDHIGGRFRLRGPDEPTVERAARAVMREYRLLAEPVQDARNSQDARNVRDVQGREG